MTDRQDQLPGLEDQPRLFAGDDLAALDALADQATEEDYAATAELLAAAKRKQRG